MIGYALKCDGGYYAKAQPTFQWAFTDDITKAYIYSTVKSAKLKKTDAVNMVYGYSVNPNRYGHENVPKYLNPAIIKVEISYSVLEEVDV